MAKENSLLLNACEENGFNIPHLCHKEGLSSVGVCRLCIVRVKGMKGLVPSCCTVVTEGMEVTTEDEEICRLRRINLEMILAEHEHNCLVCENSGKCELQNLAYALDVSSPRFPVNKKLRPIEESSEVIARDPNLCILCGRCVRACAEVTDRRILEFANRGPELLINAGLQEPLADTDCASCGACLQACPTGALTVKLARFQGRSWEVKKVQTTCTHCGGGCQIEFWAKGNRLVRAYGVEKEGAENRGHLCVKGRFGFDFVHSADRLSTPLIKKNGQFITASWDEALDRVAENFQKIKKAHGSDAIGGIASSKSTNEENYLFQKFMRACIGTNNVDFCTRFCHTPSAVALGRAFGGGAMTNSPALIEKAEVVLIAGLNLTEMYPVFADFVKQKVKAGKLKLIVVDPRRIDLVDYSQVWIRPRIGTDIAWINGLMNVILNRQLQDDEFIASRTVGFDDLQAAVKYYTPENVEAITGVRAQTIEDAGMLYGNAPRAAILYGMGVTQHIHGTDNVSGLCNLALLTGNVGKAGTGVNSIAKQNNGQGAGDMGCLPPIYPGGQPVADEVVNQKFSKAWGVPLSKKPGLTESDMVLEKGRIKGLYVMGGNPLGSGPNLRKIQEVFTAMDFVVVQDMFLSETAMLADVVLPACSFAEKSGSFTSASRLVQKVDKIIEPVGKSRPDWEILCDLSDRMGYPMPYRGPQDIMQEIAALAPSYGGISHGRLETAGLRVPCPSADHPGTEFLWGKTFKTPDGKGHFFPAAYQAPAEVPNEEYPYLLTTGKDLYHLHTGSYTNKSVPLSRLAPEDLLEISVSDAKKIGVVNGDKVRVRSRRGHIDITAQVTDRVPDGTVFATFHSGAVNDLTIDSLDAMAKVPELKMCAVTIEKVA